jgi:hypothetical protein
VITMPKHTEKRGDVPKPQPVKPLAPRPGAVTWSPPAASSGSPPETRAGSADEHKEQEDPMRKDHYWTRPWWWRIRRIAPNHRDRPDVWVRPWWWRLAWTLNDIRSIAILPREPGEDQDPWSSTSWSSRRSLYRRPSSAEKIAAKALQRRRDGKSGQSWEPF